jgi:hypothetical protein
MALAWVLWLEPGLAKWPLDTTDTDTLGHKVCFGAGKLLHVVVIGLDCLASTIYHRLEGLGILVSLVDEALDHFSAWQRQRCGCSIDFVFQVDSLLIF